MVLHSKWQQAKGSGQVEGACPHSLVPHGLVWYGGDWEALRVLILAAGMAEGTGGPGEV